MKKRLLPAISIGIAVLVIGSIAYAADRRKNTKTSDLFGDKVREEEALNAELLDTFDHQDKKPQDSADTKRGAVIASNDKKEAALLAEVMAKR